VHIIFESVLMQLTENYQNCTMLAEATACQSWRVFWRYSVEMGKKSVIFNQWSSISLYLRNDYIAIVTMEDE